jgi:hypothetical protein
LVRLEFSIQEICETSIKNNIREPSCEIGGQDLEEMGTEGWARGGKSQRLGEVTMEKVSMEGESEEDWGSWKREEGTESEKDRGRWWHVRGQSGDVTLQTLDFLCT